MKFEKLSDGLYSLDVLGYVCPHPQIYTKKALERIETDDVLQVVFDNPSSGESITIMCDNTGDEIIDKKHDEGKYVWKIKKI